MSSHKSSNCYLCGHWKACKKLFRGCQHESACHDCLRSEYVVQAQHDVSRYPLQCFHPECQLTVRNTQMERFVKSERELQNYHRLNAMAKMNRLRLGENWRDLLQIVDALGGCEICRCPSCQMLVTKSGGCDQMTCVCGAEFDWKQVYGTMEEAYNYSLPPIPAAASGALSSRHQSKKNKKNLPTLQIDEDFPEDFDQDDYPLPNTKNKNRNASTQIIPQREMNLPIFCVTIPTVHPSHKDESSLTLMPTSTSMEDETFMDCCSSPNESSIVYENDDDDESSSNSDVEDASLHSDSSWEEISEVSSVHSFHSKTGMSFLEVARMGARNASTTINQKPKASAVLLHWKTPPPPLPRHHENLDKHLQPHRKERDGEDPFDSHRMLETAKTLRGGKEKFMFNRQPKQKHQHPHQKESSRTENTMA